MATEIYGQLGSISVQKGVKSENTKILGLSYPITKHVNAGYFSKESGVSLVTSMLRQLVLTDNGERVMLPTFGTKVKASLFEPMTRELFEDLKDDILDSIARFVPGVQVKKLSILENEKVGLEGTNAFTINLTVQVKSLDNQIIDVPVKVG